MEKLYYEDQYLKEFITEVIEKNNLYYVSLDKTAFFPGGGGQHCDLGYIDNHRVIDVIEENGKIYHVTEKRPIKIHRVNCKIDWDRRLDGMQQHLGQHVLSGCFFTLFNANTVSVHVGKDISTVDIQGYLDEETIRKAEKMANAYMGENTVWTTKEMEYMRDEDHMLGTGIVNYIFETDTNSCVISYSCTQQYFYQIRQFSKDELDSYLSDEKEQGALRSLEQIIADVK